MSMLRRYNRKTKSLIKNTVATVGKRVPVVLTASRAAVAYVRGREFAKIKRETPIADRCMIFESFNGRGYSCSPRALFVALVSESGHEGTEAIWALRDPVVGALHARGYDVIEPPALDGTESSVDLEALLGEQALEELRHARIVTWGGDAYRRAYARAKYWVSNSVIPTYLEPGGDHVFIQTWHGTPLKRLGCDIQSGANAMYSVADIHERYRNEGRRLDYLLSPSPFTTDKFASAFDLTPQRAEQTIVEEGYPRNDSLYLADDATIASLKRRFDLPADKKIILYAPTWRDDQHQTGVGYTYESGADFDLLREKLGDEYIILFRAHYFVSNSFDFERYEGFVRDVSAVSDIADLYLVSDLLITDYSSVFFDYANLGRPMVFFMYDLEKYAGEIRGFYLDLADLPGPVVTTTAEVVDAVLGADSPDDALLQRYTMFKQTYAPHDDGHASTRVLDKVLDY